MYIRNCLVTGGFGLVGSAIDADYKIGRLNADLRKMYQVLDIFENEYR